MFVWLSFARRWRTGVRFALSCCEELRTLCDVEGGTWRKIFGVRAYSAVCYKKGYVNVLRSIISASLVFRPNRGRPRPPPALICPMFVVVRRCNGSVACLRHVAVESLKHRLSSCTSRQNRRCAPPRHSVTSASRLRHGCVTAASRASPAVPGACPLPTHAEGRKYRQRDAVGPSLMVGTSPGVRREGRGRERRIVFHCSELRKLGKEIGLSL